MRLGARERALIWVKPWRAGRATLQEPDSLATQPPSGSSSKEKPMRKITLPDPVREIAHFDPFRNIESFFPMPQLRRWIPEALAEPTIKLDVTEDEKAYHVKAELPGVKKEDVQVEIDGNQVSLTAEINREKDVKKGETLVHSERFYGKQFRSFTLGREIDRKAAQAKFRDGVLELTLPKNGSPTAQRLTVQ
jgi:HSP20 family protein